MVEKTTTSEGNANPPENINPTGVDYNTLSTQNLLMDINAQLGSLQSDVKHLGERFTEARAEMTTSLSQYQHQNTKKIDDLEIKVASIKTTLRIWTVIGGLIGGFIVFAVLPKIGALFQALANFFNQ